MLKSYRVTLRRGKPGAASSVTTSVVAHSVLSAQVAASMLFPGWSCIPADVKEEQEFDECVASGQGHSFGDCGPRGETQCRYCGAVPALDAKSTAHVDHSGESVKIGSAGGTDTKLLGELLAIIHRDGGHHQATRGTASAVLDAATIIHKLRRMTESNLRTLTVDVEPMVNKTIASTVLDIVDARERGWKETRPSVVGHWFDREMNKVAHQEARVIGAELRELFARAGLL